MKHVKKLLAVVLAVALACAQLAFAAEFTDVPDGDKYQQAVEVLNALEVLKGYEDGAFRPDGAITRAEYTAAVVRMLGMEGTASAASPAGFSDTEGHWASGYISVAAAMGIVRGYEDGTFLPEQTVTYAEAVKMTVAVLGYDMLAQIRGGYPSGYLIVASERGLLDKLSMQGMDVPMTRAETALLLFNALEIPMAEETYGTQESFKTGDEDRTILYDRLGVTRLRGMVVANPYTGLYGAGKTMAGYLAIRVGSTDYTVLAGNVDSRAMLGLYVQAYIMEDEGGEDVALYLYRDARNQEIIIPARDIDDATLSQIDYTSEDGDNETHDIQTDAAVVYNGVYLGTVLSDTVSPETLQPMSGSLRIVEANDGQILFVTDLQSYVVSSVNEDTKSIYVKENVHGTGSISYDQHGRKQRVFITRDGSEIQPQDLAEGDIITVAADKKNVKDADIVSIEVAGGVVSGAVEEISEDDVIISGESYYRSAECMQSYSVGDEADFYINSSREVFYIDSLSSELGDYGYLLDTFVSTKGVSGNVKLKLLQADGTIAVYECAERVNLDGTRMEREKAGERLSGDAQLIQFRTDVDGYVTRINTALRDIQADDATFSGFNKDEFSLDKDCYLPYRNNQPGILGNNLYVIDDSTVVFDVSGESEEDYSVGTRSVFNDNTTYSVQVYDADENKVAKFVVNRGDTKGQTKIPWNTSVALIERLTYAVDDEGETRLKLTGYRGGERVELFAKDENVAEQRLDGESGTPKKLADLTAGSVIQYTTTIKGDIDYIRVLHQPGIYALPEKSWYGSGINSELLTVYGYIYTKTDGSITMTIDNENHKPYSIQGVNVYLYDSIRDTASVSTLDEVITSRVAGGDADRVFVRAYKGNVYDVVIYR